ncbi:response regulator transcription factor [Ningiella sp. W23]|uniref:response regulator transcription factor n=1 Tax=Ningiella sp. W23 TaxID=3023715 RepID=UPI0037580AE3
MITIMLVEDQALLRDAMNTLLGLETDLEVVFKCEDGDQAKQFIENECLTEQSVPLPDIILSDIEMPNLSGLGLAQWVSERGIASKFVIMTTFAKPGYVQRALSYGAQGFILKEASSDYLVNSIRQIASGKRIIDPELALMALGETDPLSEKERKALALVSEGMKTQDIADKLFLSTGTVRNYLSEAISKLQASNRIDAARIAKQKGWL